MCQFYFDPDKIGYLLLFNENKRNASQPSWKLSFIYLKCGVRRDRRRWTGAGFISSLDAGMNQVTVKWFTFCTVGHCEIWSLSWLKCWNSWLKLDPDLSSSLSLGISQLLMRTHSRNWSPPPPALLQTQNGHSEKQVVLTEIWWYSWHDIWGTDITLLLPISDLSLTQYNIWWTLRVFTNKLIVTQPRTSVTVSSVSRISWLVTSWHPGPVTRHVTYSVTQNIIRQSDVRCQENKIFVPRIHVEWELYVVGNDDILFSFIFCVRQN